MSSDEGDDCYYAVESGRSLGIFTDLDDALKSTQGYSNSRWKKFWSFDDAEEFLRGWGVIVNRIGQSYADGSWIWKAYEAMNPSGDVIVAFCDGSALRNGRQDCTAAFACLFPHNESWNEVRVLNEEHVTSNRAEYRAALAALKQADRMDPNKQKMLVVFTDSELLHNTMKMWASTWSRNGWIKSDGSPVKNRDLVEQLVNLGRGRGVMYRHVKAHTGRSEWEYQWNDRADRQARGAARDADNGVW